MSVGSLGGRRRPRRRTARRSGSRRGPARQAGRGRARARPRRQARPRARHVHRLARGRAARSPRARCARSSSSYVGLGPHGAARGFAGAVAGGAIEDRELSEWMLVGGLRAAVDGPAVPADPRRARLAARRGARLPHRARPLQRRGVPRRAARSGRTSRFVHAWRADEDGNVQFPWPPDHLADVDLLVARAARTVVVSVEEIVPADVVAAEPERTKLFGFEVDLLVEAPGGAGRARCRRSTTRTRRGSPRTADARRRRCSRPERRMPDDRLVEPSMRWTRPELSEPPRRARPRDRGALLRTAPPSTAASSRPPAPSRATSSSGRRPRAAADPPRQGRRARAAGALARRARAPVRRAPLRPDRRGRRRRLDLGHDRDADLLRLHRARTSRRPTSSGAAPSASRACGPATAVLHGFGLSMFLAGVPVVRALERMGARPVPVGAEAGTERMLRIADLVRPRVLACTPSYAPVPRRAGAEGARAARRPSSGSRSSSAPASPAPGCRRCARHCSRRSARRSTTCSAAPTASCAAPATPSRTRACTCSARTARSRPSSSTRRRRRRSRSSRVRSASA